MIDIDFDIYVNLDKDNKLAQEISKYPTVSLDYTIKLNNNKYAYLDNILKEFRSNLIKSYELKDVYQNKYTIRYILGSNNKTLEQKDLQLFKDRLYEHLKKYDLEVEG